MPYAETLSLTSPNMQVRLGLAAGARDAALGIDHEVADQPGPRQRRQRQQRRGRVAAGRADDRDRRVDQRLELGAVELRQAVDRAVEEVGPRVLEAVPARVVGRVAQAEVGPEVDDRGARGGEVGDEPRAGAVGECQEDRVDRPRAASASDGQVGRREVRMDAADRIVVALAADEPDQLDIRVARQQPDQLATDVPGRADDPDPDAPRPAGRVDAARGARDECGVWLRAGASSVVVTVE